MIRATLVAFAFSTLLFGLGYPLFITGVAALASTGTAAPGAVGETFTSPRDFHGRPTGGPSNFGATNPEFLREVQKRVDAIRAENPDATGPVPADLVTQSGSGLDPHLSVAGALYQVPRVAQARGIPAADLTALVQKHVEEPWLGIFGAPRVHIGRLNAALAEGR